MQPEIVQSRVCRHDSTSFKNDCSRDHERISEMDTIKIETLVTGLS